MCDESCECGNLPENWNTCCKCDAQKDGWEYDEEEERWTCPGCFVEKTANCEVCTGDFTSDRIVGACERGAHLGNGSCLKFVESMCNACGTYDKADNVWRCPSCMEEFSAAGFTLGRSGGNEGDA